MAAAWEKFNRGLDKEHFAKAFELQKSLKSEGITGSELNL